MASGTASPNYFSQLVANTVDTVTLPTGWSRCELINRDGSAEIFYTTDGTAPATDGSNKACRILPASISVDNIPMQYGTAETIRLISAGTPKYAVVVDV